MELFKKYILFFIVFITGSAVLIVEVAAVRILSPYFGNTIFTVSAAIGVILAALSIGYYVGGKIADRRPEFKWFYAIILAGSFSVILLQFLNLFFLPKFGHKFSIVSGPLIAAALMFFLPAFLLGMLSPFAIKLQSLNTPWQGIGSAIGSIFFWSTLGSICGSLLAGFILIPRLGINNILIGTAAILFLIGFLPLVKLKIKKRNIFVIILFGVIGLGAIFVFSSKLKANTIFSNDGVYEKIVIYDGQYKEKPTRFFQQDRSNSGAMFLDSDELVYEYTKYYSIYPVFKPKISDALVIGGGAYSIPKALLSEPSNINVDVVEIEPSLFDLGKKYFKVKDDPRLKNYVEDGRRFLYNTDKKYDLIFSDVYYSMYSVPLHFTTKEFFEIAKNKLNGGGIFIANFIGSLSPEPPSLTLSEIKTFRAVFENSYFFAAESPDYLGIQNIIFVGYNSDKKIAFNNPSIASNKNRIIKNLGKKAVNIDRYDLSRYQKFTDDFSPVEYLTAKMLKKE